MVVPLTSLGRVLARGGRDEEAEAALVESIDIAAEAYGEGHEAWGDAVDAYVDFLDQIGRGPDAAAWRARAEAAR